MKTSFLNSILVLGVAGVLGASMGCDEKKPTATAPTTPPAAPASPTAAGPVKDVTDAAKAAAAGAVEKAKEAVAKPVEEAKAKAAEISAQAKDAMKGYIDSLGSTNSLLAKITNPLNAGSSMGDLSKAAQSLNGHTAVLNALPGEQKASLLGDNKGALEPLVATFKGHVDRLTKDGALGQMVGNALKGFKLFE